MSGVFEGGQLQQWDTPFNLYHEPLTPFVASFIGQGYFIRGQLLSPDTVQTELGIINGNRAYSWPIGSQVDVLLRPDDIVPDPHGPLQARISGKTFLGTATLYRLQLATGSQLEAMFPSHADHQPGDLVGIRIDADHLVLFPATGNQAVEKPCCRFESCHSSHRRPLATSLASPPIFTLSPSSRQNSSPPRREHW